LHFGLAVCGRAHRDLTVQYWLGVGKCAFWPLTVN
jgi:hypothetical protein